MSSLRDATVRLLIRHPRGSGGPAPTELGSRFRGNDDNGGKSGHYARLRAGALAGSFFFAEDFFAVVFLALPPSAFWSPRLFLSAAIRSMTFEPLGGGALASGSSMTFSPFDFCFSSMRRWSAST